MEENNIDPNDASTWWQDGGDNIDPNDASTWWKDEEQAAQAARAVPQKYSGPVIMNFNTDDPDPERRTRERFAYNEALGIAGASLTDENLRRSAAITQQMRDPRLSSQHLMKMHDELQGLDVGYSPQQIQRIQSLNQQQSLLDERLASRDITDEQYEAGTSQLSTLIGAIKPQRIPQKKSPWPPGQGIGDQWRNDAGDVVTRDHNGTVKILTRYSNTPEGLEERYFNQAYNQALKIKRVDPKTGVEMSLSPSEAAEYATEATRAWKRYREEQKNPQQNAGNTQQLPNLNQEFLANPVARLTAPEVVNDAGALEKEIRKVIGKGTIDDIKDPQTKNRLLAAFDRVAYLKSQKKK